MMIPSSASKILIGIPLDANVSVDLLGWAIRVIARPGDSIIALHVIGHLFSYTFNKNVLH